MRSEGIDSSALGNRMTESLASARLDRIHIEARLAQESSADDAAGSEDAGKAFETYFARMLVQELRRTLPGGFFSGSGSDVYGAWFDEHIGASLSERNALGFAGLIHASMGQVGPETSGEEVDESPPTTEGPRAARDPEEHVEHREHPR